MNKILVLLLMVISVNAQAVVIGLVDMQKIFSTIKDGKSVLATLEKSYNEKKKKLKAEEDKIMKLKEEMQKQSMVLSDAAKAKKEQEMQKLIMELQQKTVEYQKEINGQEQDLKKPVLDKLKVVVDEVSVKQNVDLTVELKSSPMIYVKEKKDLTDEIIKAYDAKNSK
ncbi:MAG: OmpH family outer membrane protein [Bacteriovoracaceae bacterium]|nr:OmpH family outer membrane protein [Bacteriovoracaceae bacterium]